MVAKKTRGQLLGLLQREHTGYTNIQLVRGVIPNLQE
jgi:hypothetical protein